MPRGCLAPQVRCCEEAVVSITSIRRRFFCRSPFLVGLKLASICPPHKEAGCATPCHDLHSQYYLSPQAAPLLGNSSGREGLTTALPVLILAHAEATSPPSMTGGSNTNMNANMSLSVPLRRTI